MIENNGGDGTQNRGQVPFDILKEYLELITEHRCRETEASYWEFFKDAWSQIEPTTPLAENWHIAEIAKILQGEVERIMRREPSPGDIIINVPPGTSKSSLVTKLLPVWAWIRQPSMRIITASYSGDLAREHAVKSRDLLKSEWFNDRWGHLFKMKYDENRKSQYANDKTGMRTATSIGGTLIGRHADIFIVDDPLDPRRAASEVEIEKPNRWWDTTVATRLTDQAVSVRIIVMQRLHINDLTGHCLTKNPTGYRHICLPGKISDDVRPREMAAKYTDGYLDPVRFGPAVLDKLKVNLGSLEFAGQIMQTPIPEEGNLMKPDKWFKKFSLSELEEKAWKNEHELAWDMAIDGAFTEDEINAPTALMAYAWFENQLYIREVTNVWMELPELIKFIPEFAHRNQVGKISRIFIEPKASGMPAAQMLNKNTTLNVILDKEPRGDKVARAKASLPFMEAGKVHTLQNAAWEEEYYTQLKTFPTGKYKDMVDVTTMTINKAEDPGQEIFDIAAF